MRTSRSSSVSSVEVQDNKKSLSFPFFNLPKELRIQILEIVMRVDRTIDIDFNAAGITSIFLVSNQFHDEAATAFFKRNSFRLFPTHPKAASKRAQPLVRMFAPRHRKQIRSVTLQLGPFWTAPPLCWQVDDKLGLEDMTSLKVLKIFVECDPAHPMYIGFRKSADFYTNFCGRLLENVLARLPNLQDVHIDGHSAVSPTGPLIQRLVNEAEDANKKISWGAEYMFEKLSEKLDLVRISR
jgi:hypothetical protein